MQITAAFMRETLTRRHSAFHRHGSGMPILDAWTVISEWEDIDLLAISSYRHPEGSQRKSDYPWVGYEVKVSRGDLRRELLEPGKRARARRLCNEFYFAVPSGLLSAEELAYEEPQWDMAHDFNRERCSAGCVPAKHMFSRPLPEGFKAGSHVVFIRDAEVEGEPASGWMLCAECSGRGYKAKSRVEREAPTLWVPRDVGLIEVFESGRSVVKKKSPLTTPPPLSPQLVGGLVRWVSVRPDERHRGIAAEQREHFKNNR